MKLHHILTLARVPNIPTVWSNVLMSWVLAGGHGERWAVLMAAVLGGTFIYAGGCTLNDAFDARWDREHKRDRLIPSGTLSERSVWGLGLVELLAGFAALALAGPATAWLPVLLVAAVLFYDFRHKQNPWSVVVMGACRALLVLSAAGVAGNWSAPRVLIAAGTVWAYIIVLSLLARRESRPGGGFLKALRPKWSVGRWVGEMLAAIPVVDLLLLLILGGNCWIAAVICLSLWPLCRLLQRKYAAT